MKIEEPTDQETSVRRRPHTTFTQTNILSFPIQRLTFSNDIICRRLCPIGMLIKSILLFRYIHTTVVSVSFIKSHILHTNQVKTMLVVCEREFIGLCQHRQLFSSDLNRKSVLNNTDWGYHINLNVHTYYFIAKIIYSCAPQPLWLEFPSHLVE